MKKVLKNIFIVCLSFVMMMPFTAYAEETTPELRDITLTQEELDDILSPYVVDNSMARTTGLINLYGIAIQRNGTKLRIAGKTYCVPDVVKCGFTEIVIQRRSSSSDSWSQYGKYTDLYEDSSSYLLTKEISISNSFQYRVTCVHYAKKSIFSTEKINNVSNIV